MHPLVSSQTLVLGVLAFHAELRMSPEVPWTLEPSAEEMRWMQSKRTWTPGQGGKVLWEAVKTWFDETQIKVKRLEGLKKLVWTHHQSKREVETILEARQAGTRKRPLQTDAWIQQGTSLA